MEDFILLWFGTIMAITAAAAVINVIAAKRLSKAEKQLKEILRRAKN